LQTIRVSPVGLRIGRALVLRGSTVPVDTWIGARILATTWPVVPYSPGGLDETADWG